VSNFDSLIVEVLKREGGYVNHPLDKGGPTNFGITQQTYNRFRSERNLPLQSVERLTKDEATGIYRAFYWLAARCDDVPAKIRDIHFDAAVNHGVSRAVRFVQQAVGEKDDGVFGPMTLRAVNAAEAQWLYERYKNLRYRFYTDIVNANRSQQAFLLGWLNRMKEFA
jgi:lysozyme family protein